MTLSWQRHLALGACLLLMGVAVTGCGSHGDDPSSGGKAAGGEAAASHGPATTEEQQAGQRAAAQAARQANAMRAAAPKK